jgi:signal transduction histidine kinase/CheY-like chemotaxis protein
MALQNLQGQPDIAGMNPEDQKPVIDQFRKVYDHLDIVRVTRPDGISVVRTDGNGPISYADRAWFKAVMNGSPVFRQVLVTKTGGKPAINFSTPIHDRNGKVVGVLSAVTALSAMPDILYSSSNQASHLTFVVDDEGRALIHPNVMAAQDLVNLSDLPTVRQALQGNAGDLQFADSAGERWYSHSTRLANGWIVISEVQQKVVLARAADIMHIAYGLAAGMVILLAIFTWLISTPLLSPIRELLIGAQQLAAGKWEYRVPEGRNDNDLGALARAFNAMVVSLEREYRHIEEEVNRRTIAIQDALCAAETADRAKSLFLANMSHEIRTPLNGVVGMLDLLNQTELDETQLRFAQVARVSADSLLTVINDILDFSKIEAGRLDLEFVNVDIFNLVKDIAASSSAAAGRKELEIVSFIDPKVPEMAIGDGVRLGQILSNLISNAIKFTTKGEVVIETSLVQDTPTQVVLKFSVTDNGIGIPADRKDRLFKSFSQVDASTTRKYGGTGLGLAICKRLVEMMGGEINVESELGVGSTFWFTIPMGKAKKAEVSDVKPAVLNNRKSTRGAHLLLAEDNEINQMVASEILRKAGYTHDAVESGSAAIEAVISKHYDLVLMDCQMPGMDGYEATAVIRQREAGDLISQRHIPIIALTAHAMKGDRELCIAAGMDAYVSKPIVPQELLGIIEKYLSDSRLKLGDSESSLPRAEKPAA